MNQMFDSKFFYRLRYFILGILLGTIVLWVLYWKDNRKNVYKWPSEIIKENIKKYNWELDSVGLCKLKCAGIDTSILKQSLNEATIDYSKSSVNASPCKKYLFNTSIKDKNLDVTYLICSDTIIKIEDISPVGNCNCPN